MKAFYSDVVEDICRFRENNCCNKKQIAYSLSLEPSLYCKREKGRLMFSYEDIIKLVNNNGWDINSAVKNLPMIHEKTELEEIINLHIEYRELILRLFLDAVKFINFRRSNMNFRHVDYIVEDEVGLEVINLMLRDTDSHFTVLYYLRKYNKLLQTAVAEAVGINIKKYRLFETRECCPNLEVMINICQEMNCRPTALLRFPYDYEPVRSVWKECTADERSFIMGLIRMSLYLFKD